MQPLPDAAPNTRITVDTATKLKRIEFHATPHPASQQSTSSFPLSFFLYLFFYLLEIRLKLASLCSTFESFVHERATRIWPLSASAMPSNRLSFSPQRASLIKPPPFSLCNHCGSRVRARVSIHVHNLCSRVCTCRDFNPTEYMHIYICIYIYV